MKGRTALIVAAMVTAVLLAWFFFGRESGDSAAPPPSSTTSTTTPQPTVVGSATASGTTRQPTVAGSATASGTTRQSTPAGSAIDPETKLRWVAAADLPPQAREILVLIDKGGPFRYSQDGSTFGNNERLLPQKPRGFYKEYTVKLPTSSDRGPVRIVAGGTWFFYTDDHYASFARIRR